MSKPTAKTFDELVDEVAGKALLRLVRGESWRSIVFQACDAVLRWRDEGGVK